MWSGCSLDKKVASETIVEKQTNKQKTNQKNKNKNKNENNVVKDCMGRLGTCSQYSAL